MLIRWETRSYNSRRYGRPWIARVTFEGAKPQYSWGDYIGDENGGILEVEASEGDVIASGQRDHRKGDPNIYYYIVETGGKLREVTKAEAYKHWKELTTI